MASKRIPHLLGRLLGIDPNERYAHQPQDLHAQARHILEQHDVYLEVEPSVSDILEGCVPSRNGALGYLRSLFPSASWMRRYNGHWLLGDVMAGITIGLVIVPQALAYASLAQLDPAFGLYTSFTGACLYWLFGTSKDIVIGATAIGSLLVGAVIQHVDRAAPGEYTHEHTAHALGVSAGAVLLLFGLLRLGWVIEFIPYIPISAFVTAASITIMSTQFPVALGLKAVDTRQAPYRVIIDTLKSLPDTQLDAAIGLSCIVLLFIIRGFCSSMEVRRPEQKRRWAFASSLRMTFAMVLYTLISYLVHRDRPESDVLFRIVGTIEPGFRHASVPQVDARLLGLILPKLPAIAIILVIEHVAISKAMGRLFDYTIEPSQEVVALGMANFFSPFVGGYVCTGSFGASAVLSKAGVRTPLAGVFGAGVLILALYALTGVFYYIPNAALAGLIIHAVCNLLSSPRNLYRYWQLSPIELIIWVVGVILAIFDSLETSIYAGVLLSVLVLLTRVARTRGRFLGLVQVKPVGSPGDYGTTGRPNRAHPGQIDDTADVFLPLDRDDASNPGILVKTPYPGVFIYRFSESYNYTNQAYHVDTIRATIMEQTQRTSKEHFERSSDRLWNDPGPPEDTGYQTLLPYLRALVLDFSAVNNTDVTSVQGLIDLRNQLDKYAHPDAVEWHFANVHNRWTRRALSVAGFGYPTSRNPDALGHWKPIYGMAALSYYDEEELEADHDRHGMGGIADEETGPIKARTERLGEATGLAQPTTASVAVSSNAPKMAPVFPVDRPFFHVDLQEAVDSAVRDAKSKDKHWTGD